MSSRYFDFRLALGIPVLLMALLLVGLSASRHTSADAQLLDLASVVHHIVQAD